MSTYPRVSASCASVCRAATLILVAAVGVTGCARPRVLACPLDPCTVLEDVRQDRRLPPSSSLTLSYATALMREHNPKVRAARADFATARAVACTRTPYPNPTFELGPLLLGGFDVLDATWGLETALGWTVLLADTPKLQDHVNAVRAHAALAETAAVEREEYLSLRRAYVGAQQADLIRKAREDLAEAARTATETAEHGLEAGSTTSLDVALLGLEAAEIEAELIESEETLADVRGDLGAHLGLAALEPTAPRPFELPPLPSTIPDTRTLENLVSRHNPRLTALRAQYIVAEKELRLEVAAGVPSLGMGVTYEREGGDKFGLPFGIEIPLFDRNQPGIAEACARRAAIREQYAAELTDILAQVERARARLEARRRRLALYEAQVGPAEETRKIAEEVLQQTGTFDMLRYLEVIRSTRRTRVEELASRALVYDAWADLETACGAPLLRFPHETARVHAREN